MREERQVCLFVSVLLCLQSHLLTLTTNQCVLLPDLLHPFPSLTFFFCPLTHRRTRCLPQQLTVMMMTSQAAASSCPSEWTVCACQLFLEQRSVSTFTYVLAHAYTYTPLQAGRVNDQMEHKRAGLVAATLLLQRCTLSTASGLTSALQRALGGLTCTTWRQHQTGERAGGAH